MNKAVAIIKELGDDEAEYFLDLAIRSIRKNSRCVSSTDKISEKLGTECRLAIKNIPHLFNLNEELL